ncbi:MAG: hypothetical protein BM556_10450 [Bacteriovorax sp. MedPE-SWde]|nr:MAG: hypothetical protein BM556_10450 [Bacteriovorax sp. MedPE-SWde]
MMKKLIKTILLITLTLSCSKISVVNRDGGKDASAQPQTKVTEQKKELTLKEKVEKDLNSIKAETAVVPKKFVRVKNTKKVNKFCKKISKKFLNYGWGHSRCNSFKWNHVRNSVWGDPLMWVTFGDEKAHKEKPKNMTMVLCGVHGDEITPVKFCYDILHHLHNHLTEERLKDNLIVVVPVVNPDSFFKRWPTRTNARGVDVNRNFPTKDWNKKAQKIWRTRYRKDKRRNPGKKSVSEPETLFQVNLIKRYKPNKIISVHAPLTIIDYDGPTVSNLDFHSVAHKANNLLIQMSKKAKGYRIKNYPFFPGSLGNYAGNERNIPTFTLELPSSDNRRHKEFWGTFKSSIHYALFHAPMTNKIVLNEKSEDEEQKKSN